jgi:SAM-dependent methyltransferase/uncharacterized protein YbaR (Trm112 family)
LTDRALILASVAHETDAGIASGILHCPEPLCQHEYPIIDGIPVILPDLRRVPSDHAIAVLLRDDLDEGLESLLGDAIGPDTWFDSIRMMQSIYGWDAYADLDPAEATPDAPRHDAPRPGAALRCLEQLLAMAGSAALPTGSPRVADAGGDAPRPGAALRRLGRLLAMAGSAALPTGSPRVVDAGCAAGRTSIALAERVPGALVLGIDINLGLLRLAHRALRGRVSYSRRRVGLVYDRRTFDVHLPGAERVDFWACDALALPFQAGSADMAAALNVVDCVAEPSRLLSGLADLLAPGGLMLLATPYDWSVRATPVEAWIGGHSQRAEHRGAAEGFLRTLLTEGAHSHSAAGLRPLAEQTDWPWHTRLHDRSTMLYSAHLLALTKDG